MLKSIEGFPEYEISNTGCVYSLKSNRWLKGSAHPSGYRQVRLSNGSVVKTFLIHRLVWETFNGSIPDGYEINHKDENKQNNTITNLESVTHKDNCNYGTRNERAGKGHRKYATDEEAKQMKKIKNAEWRANNREHRKEYQKHYYERTKAVK